jgi:hypothetical protein
MPTRDEKNHFSTHIMYRASAHKTDHIDAIVTYCKEIEMDYMDAVALINDVLRARIEEEAQAMRVIPRSSKLPI